MNNPQLVSIGWSSVNNAYAAGQHAARMALQRLATHQARLAIVFGSSWFDQQLLLDGIRSELPKIPVVGGSTAGEITPDGPMTYSCVVLAIAYDDIAIGVGVGRLSADQQPRLAGYQAAQQALRQFGTGRSRSGLLLFGDGLLSNYAEVTRGFQEVLGRSFLIAGGLMGDDLQFAMTSQYANDHAHHQAVVGLLLGGSCTIGVGMEHGFEPISRPLTMTRAHANVVYELDGQPASSVYEEYFGSDEFARVQQTHFARQLSAFPLGIQTPTSDHLVLRSVREFGNDGSLICTSEMPEGSLLHLMMGSKDLIMDAAVRAAQQAVRPLRFTRFALVFSSALRKRLLGYDAATELARIRQVLGPEVPVIGCYTYGEQAPVTAIPAYGTPSMQTGAILIIAVGP